MEISFSMLTGLSSRGMAVRGVVVHDAVRRAICRLGVQRRADQARQRFVVDRARPAHGADRHTAP